MGQNRYGLSDADMLAINERIDNSETANDVIYNAVVSTWDAILGQEGNNFSSYVEAHGTIDPTRFAIPIDQAIEIMERMQRRLWALNISEIGITNAMLDWSNVGPSTYNDMPQTQTTDGILPPPIAALVHIPPHNKPIGAHPSIVDKDDLVNMDD